MKIRQLSLQAFAHFTDRQLDFGDGDFHIVYGPNEAGKSSALRALQGWLFGIEARSADNFLHGYGQLRIGGELENSAGERLSFIRRKGNKNTLLTPEGEVLDDTVLAPFLAGVTREIFTSMFGIDHRALIEGGEEILQQRGELGQMLFSAALGSQTLQPVMRQLTEEARQLFAPRGKNQTINRLLGRYRELQQQIRAMSQSSSEWDQSHRALQQARQSVAAIDAELAQLRREHNRLARIQRSLPKLARRQAALSRLAEMPDAPDLPVDFGERHHQALALLAQAQTELKRHRSRLRELETQRQAQAFDSALIEQSAAIDALFARLAQYRQARTELPGQEAEYRQRRADVEQRLRTLRPKLVLDDIDSLRPLLLYRRTLTDLAERRAVLDTRLETRHEQLATIERKLGKVSQALAATEASGEATALRQAVTAARKLGEIDESIESMQLELGRLQHDCDEAARRLALPGDDWREINTWPVPGRETVKQFEQRDSDHQQQRRQTLEEQRKLREIERDAQMRLEAMRRVGAVPTEADLETARARRDEAWQALRQRWTRAQDASSPAEVDVAMIEQFEQALATADTLSDRLRREAGQVHAWAEQQARARDAAQQLAELEQALARLDRERADLDEQWAALWRELRIEPGSPAAMRDWLDSYEGLRQQVKTWIRLDADCRSLRARRDRQIEALRQAWPETRDRLPVTDRLEPLLAHCEQHADRLETEARARATLASQVDTLETERETHAQALQMAEQALQQWRDDWQALRSTLGLSSETTPTEAVAWLDSLKELLQLADELRALQARWQTQQRLCEDFERETHELATRLGRVQADESADQTVARLADALAEAREIQIRQQQMETQITELREEIDVAEQQMSAAQTQLQALCEEASCEHIDELEGRWHAAQARRKQLDLLEALEQDLLETGEGVSLELLLREAAEIDPDRLPATLAELAARIDDELEPRKVAMVEERTRREAALARIDGGDQAAELADEARGVLAEIRAESEKYIRFTLAGRILRDEIERYRRDNQGPLLNRASEHFTVLTLGSFSGLKADLNERDEPILVGVRPDGTQVGVQGMSAGSRDQLYLALRLASLERYLSRAEPMPFIVDDVLVDFDDRRAEAALSLLAGLAQQTQVILFTHHARIVEQAAGQASVIEL